MKLYTDDRKTRRSTIGIVAVFRGGIVSWTSQLQKVTATSTTEAVVILDKVETNELIWLKVLNELTDQITSGFYMDNACVVKLVKTLKYRLSKVKTY